MGGFPKGGRRFNLLPPLAQPSSLVFSSYGPPLAPLALPHSPYGNKEVTRPYQEASSSDGPSRCAPRLNFLKETLLLLFQPPIARSPFLLFFLRFFLACAFCLLYLLVRMTKPTYLNKQSTLPLPLQEPVGEIGGASIQVRLEGLHKLTAELFDAIGSLTGRISPVLKGEPGVGVPGEDKPLNGGRSSLATSLIELNSQLYAAIERLSAIEREVDL